MSVTQQSNLYDHDLMRKFALILIKDIVKNRNSRVKNEFSELLTEKNIEHIQSIFANKKVQPDNDINVSIDQTENLMLLLVVCVIQLLMKRLVPIIMKH